MTDVTTRLRARNQLTLPDSVVHAAGLDVGATRVVELDPEDGDVGLLRRVRASYAGTMTGAYGPSADYLAGERAGWPNR